MYKRLSCLDCSYHNESANEITFEELKAKVMKITESINCIANSELSYDVKKIAINELKEKKAKLIELMHKKVDEL